MTRSSFSQHFKGWKKMCPLAGAYGYSEQEGEVTGYLVLRFSENGRIQMSSTLIEN
jgi:hypothetical protein